MKASRFNLLLGSGSRPVVFNSLSGSASPLTMVTDTLLRRGTPDLLDRTTAAHLRRLGILVEDEADETNLLRRRIQKRIGNHRVADLCYLVAPSGAQASPDHSPLGLIQAITHVGGLHRLGRIDLAKLRLAGHADHPLGQRTALLARARRELAKLGVPLVTMWMTDQLQEARVLSKIAVEAFFLHWDLSARSETASRDHLRAIDALLGQGRAVAIQLAIRDLMDIEHHRELLRWAATSLGGDLQWDVTNGDSRGPYFLPAVCTERDPTTAALLATARATLTGIGLPMRAAIAPFHHHPGCPTRSPLAVAFDHRGRLPWCLAEIPSPGGEAPGGACRPSPLSTDPMISTDCAECAHLPFCLARCPRQADYGRSSPQCAARKQAINDELLRLISSGQIGLSSPARSEPAATRPVSSPLEGS